MGKHGWGAPEGERQGCWEGGLKQARRGPHKGLGSLSFWGGVGVGGGLEGGEALRLFGGRRGNFEQALDWKGRDGKRSALGLGGWTGD